MKKSALMLFLTLLPFMAKAQNTQNSEDGKKIDKEKLESKDYLPEIHGTIRGKYEYQTTMGAGRFEVRNARVSVTGNVLPIVAYKAEIDLSDEGSIKMLDAYARLADARAFYHRRTPITPPAIFCQPLVHSQAGGQRTRCRYHTGIYPAYRPAYYDRRRTVQRFGPDQSKRMA